MVLKHASSDAPILQLPSSDDAAAQWVENFAQQLEQRAGTEGNHTISLRELKGMKYRTKAQQGGSEVMNQLDIDVVPVAPALIAKSQATLAHTIESSEKGWLRR